MSEQNNITQEVNATEPMLEQHIRIACDIAMLRVEPDQAESAYRIKGAMKDLNSKGRGPCWYRMVYRNGTWEYVAKERLPSGSFRAAERRATVYGDVYTGEIIVQHDRGGPVDTAILVSAPIGEEGERLVDCKWTIRRDGKLSITLPDGSMAILEDPRKNK